MKLKYRERRSMREALPLPARYAFIAFAAQRCIAEARRFAPVELDQAVALVPAVALLWRAADGTLTQSDRDVKPLVAQLQSYTPPSDPEDRPGARFDLTVTNAMWIVVQGLEAIAKPEESVPAMTRAFDATCETISRVYADGEQMKEAEVEILDEALRRLASSGANVSRSDLESISDYERGPVSERYLKDRRGLPAEDEDDG